VTTQQLTVRTADEAFVHRAGAACLGAGLVGAAAGIFLAVVPAQVGQDVYGYPLAAGPFAAIQVLFFLQHLALAVGLVGVWRARVLGPGRLGAWGLAGALAGMGLLAAVELAAIGAADAAYPSPRTDALDGLYGVSSVLIGIGMILAGVAVCAPAVGRDGGGRWCW
jgi:hypothetical protein